MIFVFELFYHISRSKYKNKMFFFEIGNIEQL